ncbi:MAG: hypothetical protein ABSC94_33935, partial [Polyangiaceae bacterium]
MTIRPPRRVPVLLLPRALVRSMLFELASPPTPRELVAAATTAIRAAHALVLARRHGCSEPIPTLRASSQRHGAYRRPHPTARAHFPVYADVPPGSRSRPPSDDSTRRGGSRSRRRVDHDEGAAEA